MIFPLRRLHVLLLSLNRQSYMYPICLSLSLSVSLSAAPHLLVEVSSTPREAPPLSGRTSVRRRNPPTFCHRVKQEEAGQNKMPKNKTYNNITANPLKCMYTQCVHEHVQNKIINVAHVHVQYTDKMYKFFTVQIHVNLNEWKIAWPHSRLNTVNAHVLYMLIHYSLPKLFHDYFSKVIMTINSYYVTIMFANDPK